MTDSTYKILIVDDSTTVRSYFREVFNHLPEYRAEFASSGFEAIDIVRRAAGSGEMPFDFILCDINMPEMNGFETLGHIKEILPGVKTGMITSFNIDDYINMALERGIYNIICKTDPPGEIVRTVHTLITGEDLFGIENYLGIDCKIHRIKITETGLLKAAVAEVLEFAEQYLDEDKIYGLKTGLVEMGTNAIYHAYGYEKGTNVSLQKSEEVYIEYGTDGERLVVVIIDRSGTLSKEKVLTQLNKCINPTHDDLVASGGRGIYLTRYLCDKVVINLIKRQRTEVVLIMNLTPHSLESKPLLINQV